VAAFRGFEDRGRIELISSAATHGFLPLLARDESIRLQLTVAWRNTNGCSAARRPAAGCLSAPIAPADRGTRRRAAAVLSRRDRRAPRRRGYRYFFVDTHLVRAGEALGYPDVDAIPVTGERTPYVAYRVASAKRRAHDLFALVRDPKASSQVWSRAQATPAMSGTSNSTRSAGPTACGSGASRAAAWIWREATL